MTLNAGVIETFNYDTGTLSGTATGTGLTGDWTAQNSVMQIISGSLSGVTGYTFAPTGNRLSYAASTWGWATVGLATGNTIDFGSDSTTYFSFLADFGDASKVFQLIFLDGGSTIGAVGDGIRTTLSVELGSAKSFSGSSFPANTTLLVVGKIETVANNSLGDTISASFFTDVSAGEPVEWDAVRTSVILSGTVVDQLQIYGSGNDGTVNYQFDEFRMGSTFASVVSDAGLTGYDLWASGHGIGAATNDLDADGLSNFGEYALGGDPTNSAVKGISPVFSKSGNGFIYVHPKRSDDSTLIYTVEISTNLVSGTWTNEGYTVTGTNVTGGSIDFVTNDVGIIEKDKFIRLKIEQ
jgi:hypothetical protein